ncbi:MAG: TIGR00730 family Rossman fold protein [Actinomycetota bacterium]
MPRICVYMGSSPGSSPAYARAARALGEEIARSGTGLVYGGGDVGLMGVVADAALAGGGEVIGVITDFLVAKEVAHDGLTELHVTSGMHERKALMADLADGFIVMPGGLGTLDEAFEVLTWNQLGLIEKATVFLDVAGFWTPLMEHLARAADAGFVRREHLALVRTAHTAPDAVRLALEPVPHVARAPVDHDVR